MMVRELSYSLRSLQQQSMRPKTGANIKETAYILKTLGCTIVIQPTRTGSRKLMDPPQPNRQIFIFNSVIDARAVFVGVYYRCYQGLLYLSRK